ncbi:MAG: 16S rRNA (cytosine(1402)-N(4))-methyltransferase RsmH [Planctomycetota bacterium]
MEPDAPHLPVLPDAVLELLSPVAALSAEWLLDGTLGAGGHAALLLEALPEKLLLGLDRDPAALALAGARLAPFGARVALEHAAYAEAPAVLERRGTPPLAAALLDLGVSSMQLDTPERGFSFMQDGPLDMRMDPSRGPTAAELLATIEQDALADLIYALGEERHSRRIAREIVEARARAPLTRTRELAALIERLAPPRRAGGNKGRGRRPGAPRQLHPATRTFQALRLAVNDELGQLERSLPALWARLAVGGRLAIISFHSLEDRPVKHFFKELASAGQARLLTKKPRVAEDDERARNPRARSAKLRVAEKLAEPVS